MTDCPPPDRLLDYLEGDLSEAASRAVEDHVETGCSDGRCKRVLAGLLGLECAPPEVPGYRLDGGYKVGGMGAVYFGVDLGLLRPVAVKVLRKHLAADAGCVARFEGEARLCARLQHPGIVPVYEVGRLVDGRPFYAMRHVRGETLAEVLAGRKADLARLLTHVQRVAEALAYAHDRGVIHRDVTPANVLVGTHGEVMLMDWGLAKELGAPETPDPAVVALGGGTGLDAPTSPGAVLGTRGYMAPEQAAGRVDEVDKRSDVFSLGAILSVVLTRLPPHDTSALGGLADGPPLPAGPDGALADAEDRLLRRGGDAELVVLTRRCLSRDRDDRLADAAAVARAIADHLARVEDRLRQAELDRKTAELRAGAERKQRRLWVGLAGVTAALVAVASGVTAVWWAGSLAALQRKADLTNGILAALVRAEDQLGKDMPDVAGAALREARSLANDWQADTDAGVMGRLTELETQWQFLAELGRIRDGVLTFSRDGFQYDVGRRRYPKAFQGHGIDVGLPEDAAKRLSGWAIRDQVAGGLDLWLSVDPRHPGLLALLAEIDPDARRNAWRAAFAGRDAGAQARAAEQLAGADHPAPFVGAYAEWLPRGTALRLLRSAWARRPDDFLAGFALGNALLEGDGTQKAEAVGFFRSCVALRPRNPAALNNLGFALAATGDAAGAIPYHRAAAENGAGVARVHFNLAHALAGTDPAAAVATYRKAVDVDPGFADAHTNLGILLLAAGDDAGAAVHHREALRLRLRDRTGPDRAVALLHLNLGNALRRQNPKEAVASYREAVAIDPECGEAHSNLGEAQLGENLDAAIASFRKAVECLSKAPADLATPRLGTAYYNLGYALTKKGMAKEGKDCLLKAVYVAPDLAPAHSNLGTAWYLEGEVDHAADCYLRATTLEPGLAEAHYGLGLCLRKQGDFPRAVDALERWYRSELPPPGWSEAQRRSAEQLIRDTRRLRDLDARLPFVLAGAERPDSAEGHAEVARLCSAYRRRYAEAAALYAEAFRLAPALAAADGHRLNAALAAVRAATGQGVEPPGEADRAGLRRLALAWLQEERQAQADQVASPDQAVREGAGEILRAILNHAEFLRVRGPEALALFPEQEREEWTRLWADLNGLATPPGQSRP